MFRISGEYMKTVPAKTILQKNKTSDWFGNDYNMNLYRGCCHGCIYCDSRSECYHVEDFDTVHAKENALEILRDELRRKVLCGAGCPSCKDRKHAGGKRIQRTAVSDLALIQQFS